MLTFLVLIDSTLFACGVWLATTALLQQRAANAARVALIEELGAVVHALERIAVVLETRGEP
jgi:hypothetical protein